MNWHNVRLSRFGPRRALLPRVPKIETPSSRAPLAAHRYLDLGQCLSQFSYATKQRCSLAKSREGGSRARNNRLQIQRVSGGER